MWKRTLSAAAFIGLAASLSGCALLALVGMLLNPQLLGVSAGQETGQVNFSLLTKSDTGDVVLGDLTEGGIDVLVENEDGTYSECETVDEEQVQPSEYNTLAVLMDSSGSMERTYPEEEFGDFCLTCPHDPDRERVRAAAGMVRRLQQRLPGTLVSVMDFGPEPDAGRVATRMLQGFTDDTEAVRAALDQVQGYESAGTPLYDALAEVIGECDVVSDQYEEELLAQGLIGADAAPAPSDWFEPSEESDVDFSADAPAPSVDRDLSGVRRFILVVSDGEDLNSEYYDLDSVIQLAIQNDVTIHAVGIGVASATYDNPLARVAEQTSAVTSLQRLAEATGGYYASVSDTSSLAELTRNLSDGLSDGYSRTTQACVPRDAAGEPLALTSGDRMRGIITAGEGIELPWTVLVP